MPYFSEVFGRQFAKETRLRGQEIYAEDEVAFRAIEDGYFVAEVEGTYEDFYEVIVDYRDKSKTVMKCTCPRFEDGHLCKHIYASLLEADYIIMEDGDDVFFERSPRLGKAIRADSSYKGLPIDTIVVGDDSGEMTWHHALARLADEKQRDNFYSGASTVLPFAKPSNAEARVVVIAGRSTDCRALRIKPEWRERTRRGNWGKWKQLLLDASRLDEFDEATRGRLQELVARNEATLERPDTRSRYDYKLGYQHYSEYRRVAIRQPVARRLFEDLSDAGQLFWALSEDSDEVIPLQWDDSAPWRFEVDVTEDGDNRVLTGVLRRTHSATGETVEFSTAGVLSAVPGCAMLVPGSDDTGSWLAALEPCETLWLKHFLRGQPLVVPVSERDAFLKATKELGPMPIGRQPDDWNIEFRKGEFQPVLRVRRGSVDSRQPGLSAGIIWRYDNKDVPIESRDVFVELDNETVQRDFDSEIARVDDLNVFLSDDRVVTFESAAQGLTVEAADLPEIVGQLAELGWVVEADGKALRSGSGYSMSVSGRQETGIDWFDLYGKAKFGNATAELPELLAAIERGQDYVVLGDGSHGLLPQAWIDKFKPLAEMAADGQQGVSFRSSQALLLDALLSEHNAPVDFAETYLSIRDKIASAADPKPKGRPPGFRGSLRDYQKLGVGWLWFLRDIDLCGCLADDMGLGKTIQVLAHLEHVRRDLETRQQAGDEAASQRRLFLAVVPKSLVFNWCDEAARFTPRMRVVAYHGTEREGMLDRLDEYDLLVTTYATMRNDIERLKDLPFDTVVLDESQAIKNADSLAAKATRLLDAKHRIAMTGTPVENHLGELWSLFEFLNPGMLGRASVFKDAVRASRPNANGADSNMDAVRALGTAIKPFLLRRTKEAVLTELPPKIEQQIFVTLGKPERKAYDDLAAHYRAQLDETFAEKGFEKSQIIVLEALLRLRQAACHPGLIDWNKRKKKTGKVEMLLEQIEEVIASGHKALVFSQFVSLLDIVRFQLDKAKVPYEYLDGKTNDRRTPVERFQNDPAIPLFLISLKAGGHGLNLTAADHVFILDPWWNPAVEAQAIDRAHRMGQQRSVVASRLIAKDTVEEKIEKLKESKRKLAEALITDESAVPKGLTEEDVRLLLS